MKNVVLLIFLIFVVSLKAQSNPPAAKFKLFTTQLSIVDRNNSVWIANGLNVPWVEANLVHGLYFKNDRHFYCAKEPSGEVQCHVYFKDLGKGELSDFRTDSDFGKGDVINGLFTKPDLGEGKIKFHEGQVYFQIKGNLAKKLMQKISPQYRKYSKKEGVKFLTARGKHLICKQSLLENTITKSVCLVRVPIGNDTIFDDPPSVAEELLF